VIVSMMLQAEGFRGMSPEEIDKWEPEFGDPV
jgi:hypothetical protein